jgi:FixJ family two-component response regulator
MNGATLAYCVSANTASNEAVKLLLNTLGMTAELFSDPKAFLLRLKSHKPTFCVVDKESKMGDGLVLIQAIRHTLGPGLPLVIVLNPSDKVTADAAQKLAAQPLFKPFDAESLRNAISQATVLANQARARERAQSIPPLLLQFFAEVAPVLTELGQLIETLDTPEKRIKFYCGALEPYRSKFMEYFKTVKKSEEGMKLEAAVRVYGINLIRDLVLSIKLTELLDPKKGFQWDPTTKKPKVPASQTMKFARKTLMDFGEDSRYKHVAYSAGVVFDALSAIAAKNPEIRVKIQNHMDPIHDEAVKTAKAAYQMVTAGQGVALELYIVAACLMKSAGKIALAILEPSYLDLLRFYETKKVPPVFQQLIEQKKYSITHCMLGSLLCQCLPVQSKAFLSTLCFDVPLFLKDEKNKPRFDLASVCLQGYVKVSAAL